MVRIITEKQREEAWKMYEQGKNINIIAKSVNISYTSAWIMTEGRKKGFKNYSEYQEYLVQQKSFKNLNKYLAQQRCKNRAIKELSELIKSRLKELGKTQTWLAQQIGVTKQAVSSYYHGKIIPKDDILNKLSIALEVERTSRNLDDLVEE